MESEDNLFKEALISFACENYQTAKIEFKKLVDLKPEEASYLLYLGNCELKLKNYESALHSFDLALKLGNDSSFNLNYSKGKACFFLNKYVDSRICFTEALKNTKDPKQTGMILPWMNKLDIELKSSGVIGYNQLNDKELKVINNWMQDNKTISLELTCNHNLADFNIELSKKSISIKHNTNEKMIYTMNLTNSIIPEESTYKKNGMKAEFKLIKEVPDFNWVNLEVNKNEEQNTKVGGYYPSSSKIKKNYY